MTYDVVTLDAADREHLLATGVPLEQAHATARAHCGLLADAAGTEDGADTVYLGEGEVFATVTGHRPPCTGRIVTWLEIHPHGTAVGTWRE